MSQIGSSENADWFACCMPITCVRFCEERTLSVRINGEVRNNLWFWMPICPLHLKLSKINLEMNLIAKHKYTESQKLDMRTQRWQLERHIAHVKSNNIFFCVLCFCVTLCNTRKASESMTFYSETKSYSVECSLCYYCNTTGQGWIHTKTRIRFLLRLQQTYKIIATGYLGIGYPG